MTDHATPAVTHDDGLQNGSLVGLLAKRVPTALGGGLAALITLIAFVAWAWSLVVTWMGHGNWGAPLFQVTVAALIVIAVAGFARKTLAWLPTLVLAVLWVLFSALPLIPIVQVVLQAVLVTLLLAAVVFAVVAANQAEKPRF